MNGEARTPDDPLQQDADGAVLAQPVIDRERFHGQDGMRRLPLEGRFESRDAEYFEAEVVRARLGKLVLRRISMTAYRSVVYGSGTHADSDTLRLLTVQHGVLFAAPLGGKPLRLEVGDAVFTSSSHSYVYQANDPIVVVASTLPVSSLPVVVRRVEDVPIGPLPHSPLVDGVVDLLVKLADRLDEPWSFDADYAARGLIDLETAILTEVLTPQTPLPGPDRVYSAAVDYIERHLAEPELRPPQIAEALGVSLRYLHRSFDHKEVTVARLLRERRLEQVAATLRASERPPSLQHLASRFGFANQDQLARAFRRQYGISMTEYRSADRS